MSVVASRIYEHKTIIIHSVISWCFVLWQTIRQPGFSMHGLPYACSCRDSFLHIIKLLYTLPKSFLVGLGLAVKLMFFLFFARSHVFTWCDQLDFPCILTLWWCLWSYSFPWYKIFRMCVMGSWCNMSACMWMYKLWRNHASLLLVCLQTCCKIDS